ncbi:MAG: S8 family serine peptidase, partial [Ilumatobacteraceae bacterium]
MTTIHVGDITDSAETAVCSAVDTVLIAPDPVTVGRRGRVWKAPARSAIDTSVRPRGHALIGLSVAGALALGGAAVARLDDGPTPSPVDGSLSRVIDQIGARSAWAAGITGTGVRVAVIDTGTAPVGALSEQVVATVDLSSEQNDPSSAYRDTFGHGTHMGGIIAGHTPGVDPLEATGDDFVGVAPDAQLISVKVAGRDGRVTRDSMIAGIDWVIEHADELDTSVLALAFDAPATGSYVDDPLAAALERAWNAGIVVVTSAGNDGSTSRGLSAPAYDPFVIAVAGVDGSGSAVTVPSWASRGDRSRTPDIAAPGAHIESLRAPGSNADSNHPEARVGDQLFLASGSSQATAVTAGAVALLLEARPELTPDQVKQILIDSASSVDGPVDRVGHGMLDIAAALDIPATKLAQTWAPATAATPVDAHGIMSFRLFPASSSWSSSSWSSSSWSSSSWSSSSWS